MLKKSNAVYIVILCLCLVLIIQIALAQQYADTTSRYNVFYWENFEKGVFPPNMQYEHGSTKDNTGVYSLTSPDAPSGILDGAAITECGRHCLRLQTNPKQLFLSVTNNQSVLERPLLGEKGKALFQADIYYSLEESIPSNVAVLAISDDSGKDHAGWRLYRFGFSPRIGKLFFSSFNRSETPDVYVVDDIKNFNLKIPGWHRFQIIFEGQENIICAVDGRPTKFSPIKHSAFTKLHAGVIVCSLENKSETGYVDNLSIQWTNEESPIPRSPWSEQAAVETNEVLQLPGAPPASASGLNWIADPQDAWAQTSNNKRPLLFLLTTTQLPICEKLDSIFDANPSAQVLLRQFNLLRVDVNQLSGGKLAEKFKVFKIPCMIVLNENAAELVRVSWTKTSTWDAVAPQLQTVLASSGIGAK
ncbi:MAG TPA: hypothetical protein PKW18_02360 [Candidatus Sumerlaeota bacterium]|nr:MAG: hypothetical protein BWY12_00382 [candidate division BRC1 bacterium ADurb.Bin183]HOE64067.1 hypothetical protein [Candidatus Sumerlaeota bacterium]HRR31126.1 hypothetical protein [Candidatus Sumerlaeia bacterium]HON49010.1 hypothetical protein [Candidatus Sumerlaeota bacterium]HOR64382.1 hypothetical protein [Candidatus Sumerlaeota bacterium]